MKYFIIILLLLSSCSYDYGSNPNIPEIGVTNLEEVIEYVNTTPFGSCINAANSALVACQEIGLSAFTVDLFPDEGIEGAGHRICLAYNEVGKWHLFTNNYYQYFESSDWKVPVYEYFNNKFTRHFFPSSSHDQGVIF